jgi:hypothetical protein
MKNLSTITVGALISANLYCGFVNDILICQIVAYILFISGCLMLYLPIMISDDFYHSYLVTLRKLSPISVLISIALSALNLSFVREHALFYFMLIHMIYLHLLILVAKCKKTLDA